MRNCRAIVARAAPSADRTANSDWRALERTSRRFATLTQPMSSTRPTAPSISQSARGRVGPTAQAASGVAVTVTPLRACGVSRAKRAAVVASGRSDYPNQINNVLAFPGVFRGLLDARATQVTTDMLIRAANALASVVTDDELNANYIVPSVFAPDIVKTVAAAISSRD